MSLKLRDIFNDDLDSVFSYRTQRFVVIKDFWLGCASQTIRISILIYVLVYAIILNEGYIKKEYSVGQTLIAKNGGELVTSSNSDNCKEWLCY